MPSKLDKDNQKLLLYRLWSQC